MFEEFSGGYYLGRLYVEPGAREDAALRKDQFETLGEQLHGAEWAGTPLVMRFNQCHFAVRGERGVPDDTLVLPGELLDAHEPERRQGVLLAKAEVADRLLPFVVGDESASDAPLDPFVPDALRGIDRPS